MDKTTLCIKIAYTRELLTYETRSLFSYIRKTLNPALRATNYSFDTCKTTFDAETKTLTFTFEFIGSESATMAPLESMRSLIQVIVDTYRFHTFEDEPEAFVTYAKMCEVLDAEC
jgi:hypothetical protein